MSEMTFLQNTEIKKANRSYTYRFLFPKQLVKDGNMDTSRQDIDVEDNCAHFLSRAQANSWKTQTGTFIGQLYCYR